MKTDAFKTKLAEEKTRLERELEKVARRNPANPSDWEPLPPTEVNVESDPVDIADFSTGFDTNASIVADLETRYNEVVAALSRIEEGTYGVCTVGGEKIEVERLEADPAAKTCVAHRG